MAGPLTPPRACKVEGCTRKYKGRGYCELHRARAAKGLPLEPDAQHVLKPSEKRARTTAGAVQIGVTLQPATADALFEAAGSGYGAQAKLVRAAITQFLENRDTTYWRGKYMEERRQRHLLQQRIDDVRRAIG